MKATLTLDPITIDPLTSLSSSTVEASMLRLDKLHPIVSGNKWFKLRYYIEEAISQSCSTIASFGGPYSNHLVALAYVAKENNVKRTKKKRKFNFMIYLVKKNKNIT